MLIKSNRFILPSLIVTYMVIVANPCIADQNACGAVLTNDEVASPKIRKPSILVRALTGLAYLVVGSSSEPFMVGVSIYQERTSRLKAIRLLREDKNSFGLKFETKEEFLSYTLSSSPEVRNTIEPSEEIWVKNYTSPLGSTEFLKLSAYSC